MPSSVVAEAANHLVEEFMLLANMQVAQKLVTWLPAQALVRRHGGPLAKKLGPAQEVLDAHGFNINVHSGVCGPQ
jgi:exoribonuclease R